jgi:hypothetical protein
MVHLLLLSIAQRSVVLIIFTFSIISFFFFNLVVFFFFLMIIVIVVVVVVAIVLRQQLSFFRRFLRFFSHQYHDNNLKGIFLLRNILRRVRLWLRLRWHISWCHLTSGLMSSALVGCAVRMNHLKFGNRRE